MYILIYFSRNSWIIWVMLLKTLRLPGKKSLAKKCNTSFFSGYLKRSRLCIFLVAWIMVQTMSRKFQELCTKRFDDWGHPLMTSAEKLLIFWLLSPPPRRHATVQIQVASSRLWIAGIQIWVQIPPSSPYLPYVLFLDFSRCKFLFLSSRQSHVQSWQ